jgi:hypothetical protein
MGCAKKSINAKYRDIWHGGNFGCLNYRLLMLFGVVGRQMAERDGTGDGTARE